MHMREHKPPKKGHPTGLAGILQRLSVKTAKIQLAEWLDGPEETACRINPNRFGNRNKANRSWWH